MWAILVDSPTWMAYSENYSKLQLMLNKHQGVLNYLERTWLKKYKEMFVSVWIDQHLNFGERTTNRVEIQHAKLKKYLNSANSSLDKFVGCIDEIVKSQVTAIKETFGRSDIVLKHEHNVSCFRLLHGFVSLESLDLLVGELQRLRRLQDSLCCGCKLRYNYGLPCACMLLGYLNSGECISLESIDVFWRKLDLDPSLSLNDDDIRCDGDLNRFKEKFNTRPKLEKKSILQKLRDILQPGKTYIKEPSIQINTCGRPSLKQQQKKKKVDSMEISRRRSYSKTSKTTGLQAHRYSCSDVKQKPPRHSLSFMDLDEETPRHSSNFIDLNNESLGQCSYEIDLNEEPPLLEQIPDIFHPYITHIQDVRGDGNCGFRSVAVCLGYSEDQWPYVRQQLLDELLSSYDHYSRVFYGIDEILTSLNHWESTALERYWMTMSETGISIANRFGVILHYLTSGGSITFFPLWKGPEEFPLHRVITIAHVNGNHYVMVHLDGQYPMATIAPLWVRSKAPAAVGWETMYKSRLDFYKQLRPTNRTCINLEDD